MGFVRRRLVGSFAPPPCLHFSIARAAPHLFCFSLFLFLCGSLSAALSAAVSTTFFLFHVGTGSSPHLLVLRPTTKQWALTTAHSRTLRDNTATVLHLSLSLPILLLFSVSVRSRVSCAGGVRHILPMFSPPAHIITAHRRRRKEGERALRSASSRYRVKDASREILVFSPVQRPTHQVPSLRADVSSSYASFFSSFAHSPTLFFVGPSGDPVEFLSR